MKVMEILAPSHPKVSPEVGQYINSIFAELVQEYPQVGGFVNGIAFTPKVTSEYDVFDRQLRISYAGLDGTIQQADEWQQKANQPGFAVGHGLRALIEHEFGHAIDHYIIEMSDEEGKDRWFQTKRHLAQQLGPASTYAAQRSQEWLPEQFVAERNGLKPPVLLKVIAEFLQTVLHEDVVNPWSPQQIKWWSSYARSMLFKTPQEAQQWVLRKLTLSDQGSFIGKPNGPELNQRLASTVPLYQSGKSWKIGKRVRRNTRLTWKDIEVRRPSLEYLNEVAQSNDTADYDFLPIKFYSTAVLLPGEGEYDNYRGGAEGNYIRELAMRIKENGWLEAVIIGVYPDGIYLLEGQHRTRAMKYLGFKSVPATGIKYHY